MSDEKKDKGPTLEERLAAAEKENAKLKGKVKDLNEELAVKETVAGDKALPTVKVAGQHYQFVSPKFRTGKNVVTAADAAKDADLCADLVKKGSGVLKPIVIK